ncbi:hypothetical protein CYPRO_1587 [Cyclonatronum proteinivorum]|uniref:Uncharacterized protein n=1 Tax=Cyclonatronum proteinivorum TaxID=1457365 RepID=A0A345UK36_9BACT|nr:hypothetical protein CYPRO_1587 [Cyclonatronum proteinivorum]
MGGPNDMLLGLMVLFLPLNAFSARMVAGRGVGKPVEGYPFQCNPINY